MFWKVLFAPCWVGSSFPSPVSIIGSPGLLKYPVLLWAEAMVLGPPLPGQIWVWAQSSWIYGMHEIFPSLFINKF